MSDLVIYRFQPDAMEENVLRKLFIVGTDILNKMKGEIEKAIENKTPRYYLIVGPRGIGKSHFMTLLNLEIGESKGALRVKLSEEEYSVYRVSDFLLRIFDEKKSKRPINLAEMDESEIVDFVLEDLRNENKMIIIFLENLDQILEKQMEEQEVKRLRSIFQEEDIFIVVATSPIIFNAISQGSEPFYNFFDIKHLRELNKEEIMEMIRIINEFEGKLDDLRSYYRKIDSIVTLTGGNPRIVVLLYDLMCKNNIVEVENAFFKILDEYTPYYQDLFRMLTGQKRRIFDILISMKKPSTPKEIAGTARLDNNVVVTQLKRLEKDGYVVSHRLGRNVKYEVKERLFRLWREQRQTLGRKRISTLIEFIKLWYTPEEREKELLNIINHLEADINLIKKVEYFFYALSEESKSKLIPEITRGFCECGIPKLLEDLVEKEDERLKKAITFEKFSIFLKNKRYEDLLEETEKRIREMDDNETTLYFKGHALVNLERYEEAIQAFERVLEINSESACTWCNKGWTLMRLKRYEEALQAFDKALETKIDCFDIWNYKGVTFGNLERYEEAIQAFERALEIDSGNAGILYSKGHALVNLERYEEAVHVLSRSIQINPKNRCAWCNKGAALTNLERYEEALQAFDRALEIDLACIEMLYFRGLALTNLERYEEALQAFDRALEDNPENIDAMLERGTAYLGISIREFKKDNYGNAVENLKFAMDSFFGTWDARKEKARERIMDFFRDLVDLKQANVIEMSFKTIIKKNEELADLLNPISVAVEIAKTKDLKKYYDLQIEQREIVVDIVERLTESEEFLPEEYRKRKNYDEELFLLQNERR